MARPRRRIDRSSVVIESTAPVFAPVPAPVPAPVAHDFESTTVELRGDVFYFLSPAGKELKVKLTEQGMMKVRLLNRR